MSAAFAYALARLHARMADRPGDDARKRLAAIDDFGHFLQQAAAGGFGSWLKNLGTTSGPHPVEHALREAYRARLTELASWLPQRWRRVVEWMSVAPDLPVLAELLRYGRGNAWVELDHRWARLPDAPEAIRNALIERWPALDRFDMDELASAWLEQSRALLPSNDARGARMLEALLQAHLEPADPEWLERVFRRAPGASVKVFAYTGLERLDFEFLRGQLVRRRLQMREAA